MTDEKRTLDEQVAYLHDRFTYMIGLVEGGGTARVVADALERSTNQAVVRLGATLDRMTEDALGKIADSTAKVAGAIATRRRDITRMRDIEDKLDRLDLAAVVTELREIGRRLRALEEARGLKTPANITFRDGYYEEWQGQPDAHLFWLGRDQ